MSWVYAEMACSLKFMINLIDEACYPGVYTATIFAYAFYQRLKSGKAVAQATRVARDAPKLAHEPTRLASRVYDHPYARMTLES